MAGAAALAWSNSIIKKTVVEFATQRTLARLLRVNKATFRLAVEALYRILEDYEILEGVLGMATNQASWMTAADVYLAYSKSVRTLDFYDRESHPIAKLVLACPNLSTATSDYHKMSWRTDAGSGTVKAIITTNPPLDLAIREIASSSFRDWWETHPAKISTPDEWSKTFRWAFYGSKTAQEFERFLAQYASGEFAFPESMRLPELDLSQYGKLAATLKGLVHTEDHHMTLDFDRGLDHEQSWQCLDLVARYTPFAHIATIMFTPTSLLRHATTLRRFRVLSFGVSPWAQPTMLDMSTLRVPIFHDKPSHGSALHGAHITCCIHLDGSEARTIDMAIDRVANDTTWLGIYARVLLYVFRPLARYTIRLEVYGYPGTGYAITRASDMSRTLTARVHEIIDTIVQTVRERRAPRWKRLSGRNSESVPAGDQSD